MITALSLIAVVFFLSCVHGGEEQAKARQAAATYFNQGLAYCNQGQYDSGIRELTKALELNPQLAEAYSCRGGTHGAKGDLDKAVADCTKAIELNPQLVAAYRNRSFAYYHKHDYDKAWADVKRCRQLGGTPAPRLIENLTRDSGRAE